MERAHGWKGASDNVERVAGLVNRIFFGPQLIPWAGVRERFWGEGVSRRERKFGRGEFVKNFWARNFVAKDCAACACMVSTLVLRVRSSRMQHFG